MEGNQGTQNGQPSFSQYDKETRTQEDSSNAAVISVEHLQRLVRLLDQSEVSELEFKHSTEGTRLVLRKAKAPESNGQSAGVIVPQAFAENVPQPNSSQSSPADTKHLIKAHLVGVFHFWAKPKGGSLVALGDHVKVGQLVATIESLNVINDVESPVAGRVIEIFVKEGQSVEYGQKLMSIDSTEGA